MALRKPLFMGTEGFGEEMAATDSLQLGGLTMSGDIAMGGQKVTGLGTGTNPADAVTKQQLDEAVVSGGSVKELLFDQEQLDNTDGINALEVLFFENQPVATDTVTIKNGTLTRTYTFVANIGAEVAATDVSIETTAATAMQRLVTRANADAGNTQWDLFWRPSEHPDIHADGVITVVEKASAAGASDSRIYGTFGTQADLQVVEYASGTTPDVDLDYSNEVSATASTTDPGYGRFGLRRQVSALAPGEIHYVLTNDSQYAWDDDAGQWNVLSGAASIPDATSASGGGVKGKVTFDSDKGLSVTSGVAEILIDETPDTLDVDASGLKVVGLPSLFKVNGTAVGATVTATALDDVTDGGNADSYHSHAHNQITGIGADDHHNRSHDIESVSDHTLSGASAGEVLRATGATTFAFQSLQHSDLGGITATDHHNQSHVLTAGDHTESGLTAGHVLTASGATTFGWAAPAPAEEAKKVENTETTATDTTANGDPVYINGNDTVGKARADTDAKARVIGVIRSGAGAPPATVEVVNHGVCAGILTTAVANTPYYLGSTGGISTSLPGGGNRVIQVGKAKNADDLWVQIIDYGKKAA
jgi:hypothetical protein